MSSASSIDSGYLDENGVFHYYGVSESSPIYDHSLSDISRLARYDPKTVCEGVIREIQENRIVHTREFKQIKDTLILHSNKMKVDDDLINECFRRIAVCEKDNIALINKVSSLESILNKVYSFILEQEATINDLTSRPNSTRVDTQVNADRDSTQSIEENNSVMSEEENPYFLNLMNQNIVKWSRTISDDGKIIKFKRNNSEFIDENVIVKIIGNNIFYNITNNTKDVVSFKYHGKYFVNPRSSITIGYVTPI